MKSTKEARKVSRQLFQASLQDGRLDASRVTAIAKQLGESKPRHYMNILHNYERLVRLEVAKRHAVVESASELDVVTRGQLEETLKRKYGQDLAAEFRVTPELIGGLRVKIGSDVFDASVRERLDRLQAEFQHA